MKTVHANLWEDEDQYGVFKKIHVFEGKREANADAKDKGNGRLVARKLIEWPETKGDKHEQL